MKINLVINNENETCEFAKIIAENCFRGFLLTLNGELGAGKTRLAKAIGEELGINQTINSPTFNILKCYKGDKYEFYHIDAYRLEGVKQDIGLDEFIEGEDICFVEWSEYIDYLLPDEYLKINITIDKDESRIFEIEGNGIKYKEVEKEIERLW